MLVTFGAPGAISASLEDLLVIETDQKHGQNVVLGISEFDRLNELNRSD